MCSSGVARRRKARTLTRGLVTAAALLTVDCVQFQAAGAEATPVFESLDLGRMSVSANPAANSPWFPVRCMCICVCKSFTRRKLLHSRWPAVRPAVRGSGHADMWSAVEVLADPVARLLPTATAAEDVRYQLLHHLVPVRYIHIYIYIYTEYI